jgi:membrane protein implicated in regulation of membrane protease activity
MEKKKNGVGVALVLAFLIYGLISIMPLWLKIVLGSIAAVAFVYVVKSFFAPSIHSGERYTEVSEHIRHLWDGKLVAVKGYLRRKW